MSYTGNITYYDAADIFNDGVLRFNASDRATATYAPENPIYTRAHDIFNQAAYNQASYPVFMGQRDITFPEQEIYLLRFLIKMPGSDYLIPQKLAFIQDVIAEVAQYQQHNFPNYEERFVYLTVRSGPLKSVNEDEFHADGFQGISIPRHIPEQNYIWADCYPTVFAAQPYNVEDLNPEIHNFHSYFNACTDPAHTYRAEERGLYIIDPYHVHARPTIPAGIQRSFFRLCFSPVEIRDDTNTPNPHLQRGPYNRDDIRNRLKTFDPVRGWGLTL